MAEKSSTPPDFETALADIEKILEEMEAGDLSLEQSLSHYEKGVDLAQHCQTSLDNAQLRVSKLMDPTDQDQSSPLDTDSD